VTYGSELWTIQKHMSENIEAFEMWCYRRTMRISYVEHVSYDEVLERVSQERLLAEKIKSQKLPDEIARIGDSVKGKQVSNKCIAVCKVATPLRELTCHMGSNSVTCHPAEVTFPPLPQPKLVLD